MAANRLKEGEEEKRTKERSQICSGRNFPIMSYIYKERLIDTRPLHIKCTTGRSSRRICGRPNARQPASHGVLSVACRGLGGVVGWVPMMLMMMAIKCKAICKSSYLCNRIPIFPRPAKKKWITRKRRRCWFRSMPITSYTI